MFGFTLLGELYQDCIGYFECNFSHVMLTPPNNKNQKEIITEIKDIADNNNLKIFVVSTDLNTSLHTQKNIYASKGVKKYIENYLNIKEKTYNSILCGKTEFNYYKFNDIPDISKFESYYLIGNINDMNKFRDDIVNKYDASRVYYGEKSNEGKKNAVLIWSMIDLILLFFTLYDTIYQKKENFIKVTIGESLNKIVLKNIVIDIIGYISEFLLSLWILSYFTIPFYEVKVSIIMLCVLIGLNSLMYISLYYYDFKEVFSNSKASVKLLVANYLLKILSIVLTVLVLSSNFIVIHKAIELYSQKEFIEEHKDYYYTHIEYKPMFNESEEEANKKLTNTSVINEKFYRENTKDSFMVCRWYGLWDEISPCLIANKNAVPYLKECIKELNSINLKEKVYIIMPKNLDIPKELFKNENEVIQAIINFYCISQGGKVKNDFEIIYYTNANILYSDDLKSQMTVWANSPIILLNNINVNLNSNISQDIINMNYCKSIMYKIDKSKFNRFLEENNLSNDIHSFTNIKENYDYHWNNYKKSLILSSTITVLVLILEYIIIISIFKLEYQVNATELSLKKILGYNLFNRNFFILIITLCANIVSVAIGALITTMFKIAALKYVIISGLIVLILDVVMILINVRKFERSNIQEILKGGKI